MEVQVIHRLSAFFSAVNDNPEPLVELQLLSKFLHGLEHGLENGPAGGLTLTQMRNVRHRYNQNMRRSLRLDIAKGHDVVVAVHDIGRELPADNYAEQARVIHYVKHSHYVGFFRLSSFSTRESGDACPLTDYRKRRFAPCAASVKAGLAGLYS